MVTKIERARSNHFKELIERTATIRAKAGLPPMVSMFAHMVIPDDDAKAAKPETVQAASLSKASAATVSTKGRTAVVPDPKIESLQSQLQAKNAELAILLTARVGAKDRPFVAAWIENRNNCQTAFPSIESYAAYQRHFSGNGN
ncbi:MAG: hypothetical protein WKF77_15890 [Planctomycetaceae bacterium]